MPAAAFALAAGLAFAATVGAAVEPAGGRKVSKLTVLRQDPKLASCSSVRRNEWKE